ncbi:MAG TPA: FAD-dependent oxidoreductase, partial [Baekduia sp.]|nr:FAD-dependent oxidoreductase [Baekduia sp.]
GVVGGLPFMDAWFDASPLDDSEGVLIGFQFASGPGATTRGSAFTDDASVRAAALADLAISFGPKAASPKEFHYFAWYGSRWSDGCAMQLPPGVLSTVGHALREPIGRIFWAGAESEPIDYMEGAVVAGKRAAAEAIRELT